MSPENIERFFYFLSLVAVLARTSGTKLNGSSNNKHHVPVPGLRGKAVFSFLPNAMFPKGFLRLREIPFYSYFTKKLYQLFIEILKLLQAISPLIC